MVKKALTAALLLTTTLALGGCGERVDPGFVGIKVNLYGSEKGIEDEVLTPGWYWTGWTYRVYEFPTSEVNYVFTADKHADSPIDEAVRFQSMEGMQLSVDVGLQYQLETPKIPMLFQRYRKGIDEITKIYVRNIIRDVIVQHSSAMSVEDIIGRRKIELLTRVEDDVRKTVGPLGVTIYNVSFISDIRVPPQVLESINAKLVAGQRALQRETEVQEAKAQANKEIEKAKGEAEGVRLRAIADAEALNIRGEAIRRNSEVIQLQAIEKWNGVLPQMMGGGAVPFLNLSPAAATTKRDGG